MVVMARGSPGHFRCIDVLLCTFSLCSNLAHGARDSLASLSVAHRIDRLGARCVMRYSDILVA